MTRLLAAPHRLFFFAAVLQILAVSLWWLWVLVSRTGVVPGPAVEGAPPPVVHAFLMVYGFFPLFIFGFLFTAGPRWLEHPPVATGEYVASGLWSIASAFMLLPALMLGAAAAAGVVAAYLGAWCWMLARFIRLIVLSRSDDKLHAVLAAAALAAGAFGLGAMLALLLGGSEIWARAMRIVGIWGFLVPLFGTVVHRMIPFVTANVLPAAFQWRPNWVLGLLAGGSVAHGVMEFSALWTVRWIVDLPLAAMVFLIAWRWGIRNSGRSRLLAMLHAGFVWLGVSWLLFGLQSLLGMAGVFVFGLAPVHALTVGFAATLTLAFVSRVTAGHLGRSAGTDRWTWNLFRLLQLAALLRVGADFVPGAYSALLVAASAAWSVCFVLWAWKYLPLYWMPRSGGRPG